MNDKVKTLESYKELNPNWDGYDAIKPNPIIIDRAISFLVALKCYNVELPKPMIAGSGEVGLYWRLDKTYIEVGFDETGNCLFIDSKPDLFGIDDFDETIIPKELLEKITL